MSLAHSFLAVFRGLELEMEARVLQFNGEEIPVEFTEIEYSNEGRYVWWESVMDNFNGNRCFWEFSGMTPSGFLKLYQI